MGENKRYPALNINLQAVEENARVMCRLCSGYGIEVAGVVKFSDGDLNIAKAYAAGRHGRKHNVILMQDVGDRREGHHAG